MFASYVLFFATHHIYVINIIINIIFFLDGLHIPIFVFPKKKKEMLIVKIRI